MPGLAGRQAGIVGKTGQTHLLASVNLKKENFMPATVLQTSAVPEAAPPGTTSLRQAHGPGTAFLAPAPLWQVRELVLIGVFSAAVKVSTLAVALVGGGMNPVTLMAKNCIFTTLLVVLLVKVRKSGTLLLFMGVNFFVSLLLLGGSVALLAPLLAGACAGEGAIRLSGGMDRRWGPFVGVAVQDLLSKILSVGMVWVFSRENPALLYVVAPFVAIGYLGSVVGLFAGHKAVKELRRAGLAAY
jgi:energy-coupling factor transport system substrate-specific component